MIYVVINGLLVECESVTEVQVSVRRYHPITPVNNYVTPKPHKVEEDDITTDIIREVFENVIKRRG